MKSDFYEENNRNYIDFVNVTIIFKKLKAKVGMKFM